MNRIRAVARNTIAQAVRNRVAFVVMGIYLLLVPLLPFIVRGDGTLQGLVNVVVTYLLILAGALLSVLTVALASTSLWDEMREKQIFVLESKPVRRWEILVGKFLGILLIDAVMLVFVGIALLACVRVIMTQERWDLIERELTRRQITSARRVISPRDAVSADEVRRQYEMLKRDGHLPDGAAEQEMLGCAANTKCSSATDTCPTEHPSRRCSGRSANSSRRLQISCRREHSAFGRSTTSARTQAHLHSTPAGRLAPNRRH